MKSSKGSAMNKNVSQKEEKEKSERNICLPPINPKKESTLLQEIDLLSERSQKMCSILKSAQNAIKNLKKSRSQRNKSINHSVSASSQQTKTNVEKRKFKKQFDKVEVNIIERQDQQNKNMKKQKNQSKEDRTNKIKEIDEEIQFCTFQSNKAQQLAENLKNQCKKSKKLLSQAKDKKDFLEKHLNTQMNQLIANQEELEKIPKINANQQEKKERIRIEREIKNIKKCYLQTKSQLEDVTQEAKKLQGQIYKFTTTLAILVQGQKAIQNKINMLIKLKFSYVISKTVLFGNSDQLQQVSHKLSYQARNIAK